MLLRGEKRGGEFPAAADCRYSDGRCAERNLSLRENAAIMSSPDRGS